MNQDFLFEAAKQSGLPISWWEKAREEGQYREWRELEKFAELIVRECMELGDTALQKGNWPGDAIKKHFEIKD